MADVVVVLAAFASAPTPAESSETARWSLHRPPLPRIYTPRSCHKSDSTISPPSCEASTCMSMRMLRATKHNRTFADEICDRCECAMCLICAKLVNRWTSPTGQQIESVTTRTHPPFSFAFLPADDDMQRMRQQLILEPTLTLAWHEAIWRCCARGGLVVDVGGNFGWYTLYSLALGCRVDVFEPIPAYREVLELGVGLNPGFRERVRVFPNVVYDQPGNYTLRVPLAVGKHRKKLGMTGMVGTRGVLKTDRSAQAYMHTASSVRLDALVQRDTCLLKADVEGCECLPECLPDCLTNCLSDCLPECHSMPP